MFIAKFLFLPGKACVALLQLLFCKSFPLTPIQFILLNHIQYLEKSAVVNLISANSGIPQNLKDIRDLCLFRNVFSC